MRKIYTQTYYFWMITRGIVILFGSFDVCNLISKYGISLLYLIESVYILLNSVILYKELMKVQPVMTLKYLVGTLSVAIGMGIFYWKFTEPEATWGLAKYQYDYVKLFCYILSVWLLVFGLFDFYKITKVVEE